MAILGLKAYLIDKLILLVCSQRLSLSLYIAISKVYNPAFPFSFRWFLYVLRALTRGGGGCQAKLKLDVLFLSDQAQIHTFYAFL